MKYKVMAIRDRASRVYTQPFFVAHVPSAVRQFSMEVNNKVAGNQFAAHPSDFELHQLGMFDDEDGRFHQDEPVKVVGGSELVKE